MNAKTVFEKPYVRIYVDPSVPAIYEDWIGYVSGEEFREALEAKLWCFRKYKKQLPNLTWLNDIRKLRGISAEDQAWATQQFHPKLYQNGIDKIAFIVPGSTYYRLSDEQLAGTYDARGEVQIGYFDTYKSATQWLTMAATVME